MSEMETRDRLVANISDHPLESLSVALDGQRSSAHLVARPLQKEWGEHPDGECGLIPRITGKSSLDDGLFGSLDQSQRV